MNEKKKDIFRDTPVRYLGYANELGESFRSVMDVKWVNLSYVVASSYVLADAISKGKNEYNKKVVTIKDEETRIKRTAFKAGDVLLWQSFASVIIPGFVINRICAATRYIVKRTKYSKKAKWISVGAGLISIPFIIKPIDRSVDHVMDKTIRPMMEIK